MFKNTFHHLERVLFLCTFVFVIINQMFMKVTVEIDTDKEDGDYQLYRIAKAEDMSFFIFQLVYNARQKLEHDESLDERTIEVVFEYISDLLDEYGIVIDDLTR